MSIDLLNQPKALHLYGMATAWNELQSEKPKQAHRPELWLKRMLVAEQTYRQLKSLRYQLKSVRFKVPVAQRISGVPANANQNHIDRETHFLKLSMAG